MRTAKNPELRSLFEQNYGRRISDSTWYRLKQLYNKDFPLTKHNVIWLAEVKKQLPKCHINLACLIQAVSNTQKLFTEQTTISGEKLLEYFRERDINVHANTLTKWFKPIHGFRRTRIYSAKELKPIILAAFAYKLRKDNTDTVQSLVNF